MIYALKSTLIIGLFWAFYKLMLEDQNHFHFNRFFLLIGLIASFSFPLIEIPVSQVSTLSGIDQNIGSIESIANVAAVDDTFDWSLLLTYIYVGISSILLLRTIGLSFSIYSKSWRHEVVQWKDKTIVLLGRTTVPFTFGNKIYVHKKDYESGLDDKLLLHEKAHADQWHTADILLFEVIKALFWYNPFLILYKRSIKENHEFLADKAVLNQKNELINYQYLLLKMSKLTSKTSELTSHFNFSITKKRFIMMNKNTSQWREALNAVTSIGFCILLCLTFSSKINAQTQSKGASPDELKEFIRIAQSEGETPHFDIKVITKEDAKRYMEIKMKMSNDQKEMYAEYELPPPPPPSTTENKSLPENAHYYINDKKASKEEVSNISADKILSVNVIKGEHNQEVRVILKSNTENKLPLATDKTKSLPDNAEYYINDKKATKEEVSAISPDKIESMNVVNGKHNKEIRIKLKP